MYCHLWAVMLTIAMIVRGYIVAVYSRVRRIMLSNVSFNSLNFFGSCTAVVTFIFPICFGAFANQFLSLILCVVNNDDIVSSVM